LKADVRQDGDYHSIRKLVQPGEEEVREIARVLVQADDFPSAVQDFVSSFTVYRDEVGDYWELPAETLADRAADCDGLAILTCSILRNYIAAEDVFCAVGEWEGEGHMWVVLSENGEVRIIEATAASKTPITGKYEVAAIFNDSYVFSYPSGIRDFCLVPVNQEKEAVYAEETGCKFAQGCRRSGIFGHREED